MKTYPNVVAALVASPWHLQREKLDIVRQLALKWSGLSGGPVVSFDDDDEWEELDEEELEPKIVAGCAIMRVRGIICHRASMFDKVSGLTSSEWIISETKRLVESKNVREIIVDFETPGGSAYGLRDAADVIYELRNKKPIYGIANAYCHSAGYYLLAQCTRAYSIPLGSVGSVGTYMMHVDYSEQNKIVGIDPTYVFAGDYKIEGNPEEPLGKEAKDYLQKTVDKYYMDFVNAVARGRNVSVETVLDKFGKGRALVAEDALQLGMIDGVLSYDSLIEQVSGRPSGEREMQRGRSVAAAKRRLKLASGG